MTMLICEGCRGESSGRQLRYCSHCSRDLCSACAEKGCCGHHPAQLRDQSWIHPAHEKPVKRERR